MVLLAHDPSQMKPGWVSLYGTVLWSVFLVPVGFKDDRHRYYITPVMKLGHGKLSFLGQQPQGLTWGGGRAGKKKSVLP